MKILPPLGAAKWDIDELDKLPRLPKRLRLEQRSGKSEQNIETNT